MSSGQFIIPGHHDPIGGWPTVQLENARAELLADRVAGYLPPKADQAIAAIEDELMRRGLGDAQDPAGPSGFGRALERWFSEDGPGLPSVRGMEPATVPAELAAEPVRQPEAARGFDRAQAVEELEASQATQKESRALDLFWSRPEAEEEQERTPEAEMEP